MDKLSNLPIDKEPKKISPEENEILDTYFGKTSTTSENNSSINYKLIGYATILFLILGNPWIDGIFGMIPFVGSTTLGIIALKTFLFLIIFAIILMFVN